MKDIADDWFLGRRTRMVRSKTPQSFSFQNSQKGGLKAGFGVKNLVSAANKAPEVVVKISQRKSLKSTGLAGVRGHLSYISRNGQLDLKTSDGFTTKDKQAVNDLATTWGRRGIPEQSNSKEALNFILSMPKGTDPKKVEAAAANFAERNFKGTREYAYVLHEDTDDPHVHLCVLSKDDQGKRLNPRKADLHLYRVQFAEELTKLGVECAATNRQHRGKLTKGERQAVIHMKKDGRLKLDQVKIQDLVNAVKDSKRPDSPALKKILETREFIKEDYAEIAKQLFKNGYKAEARAISKLRDSLDQTAEQDKVKTPELNPTPEQSQTKPKDLEL